MRIVNSIEEQRLFLKAVGLVLANEDIGLIEDSVYSSYGFDGGVIIDFEFGFSSFCEAELGQKIKKTYEQLIHGKE